MSQHGREKALAVRGGPKLRQKPFPPRRQFGKAELAIVKQVFEEAWAEKTDFGFQGKYENLYTDAFCKFQGGGYCDAVSSGTNAIYLALAALNIAKGSDVIVSPVTDPGSVSPVILQGFNPVVCDSMPNSFNIGPEQFAASLTDDTRAAVITHTGGWPCDMTSIMAIARLKNIKVIEDCSQAHGAQFDGEKVGNFGEIAVFSTMFSKNHATGGCGGLVFTKDKDLYWRVRALADRGKPFAAPDFNPKDPSTFLFPALNFNLDELSCAIGFSTLSRLSETISKRLAITAKIDERLDHLAGVYPVMSSPRSVASPFFHIVGVSIEQLSVCKQEFAEAIEAEGIGVNPHYRYVVAEWNWVHPYLVGNKITPNAIAFRNRTFNILFNENYTEADVIDIIRAIEKVSATFCKN